MDKSERIDINECLVYSVLPLKKSWQVVKLTILLQIMCLLILLILPQITFILLYVKYYCIKHLLGLVIADR